MTAPQPLIQSATDAEEHSNTKHIRILGIGSPFGDDQVGFAVVNALEQSTAIQPLIPKQVQLYSCDRPGTYLLTLMHGASTVFLIDAIQTGAPIGSIHRFCKEDIITHPTTLSTHAIGLADTIQIGAAISLLPQNIVLYGIEIGRQTEYRLQLTVSETIAQAIQQLCLLITEDLFKELNDPTR